MDMWPAQRRVPKHQYSQSHLRTTLLLLKLSFLGLGLFSFIHFARFAVPSLHHFISHTLPSFWLCLSSWLSFTPFLYIILNCIILTIAATSSLQHKSKAEDERAAHKELHPPAVPQPEVIYHHQHQYQHQQHHHQNHTLFQENSTSYQQHQLVQGGGTLFLSSTLTTAHDDDDDEDASFIARSSWSPLPRQQTCPSPSSVEDKPLASARFTHKKSAKASPDTKSSPLRITRPKKEETLQYTWKTITDGRHPPLARHLKKSDTWDTTPRVPSAERSSPRCGISMRNSQTMRQRTAEDSPASSASASPARYGMKREPSLSQDELNKRVEAFISKFNNEIRLQRQNSFQSYMERINRSSH